MQKGRALQQGPKSKALKKGKGYDDVPSTEVKTN